MFVIIILIILAILSRFLLRGYRRPMHHRRPMGYMWHRFHMSHHHFHMGPGMHRHSHMGGHGFSGGMGSPDKGFSGFSGNGGGGSHRF